MALAEPTTVLTEERIREIVLRVVEEVVEPIRKELGQPTPEWSEARQVWLAIGALTEAQHRTEERLQGVEEALRALAEAQRRTEERVEQLAEAQRRTEEELRAYREASEARFARIEAALEKLAEAQRRTEEELRAYREASEARFARIEATLAQLIEAQRRTEEELRAYREASEARFARIEATLAQLIEAQRQTEERLQRLEETVRALAEAHRQLEERVTRLEDFVQSLADRLEKAILSLTESIRQLAGWTEVQLEQLRSELGRIANRLGLDLEVDAEEILWAIAAKKGIRILYRPTPIVMDGEVDLAAPVEMPDGTRGWVLIEVKGRLRQSELEDWVKNLRNPSFQEKLRDYGVKKPYLPYMFALRVYYGVEEKAQEAGIGILTFRGEMVPARLWE